MNRRKIGMEAEERASLWLAEMGMEILERNFRCRQGEVDIIGRHEGYLVFVEVKYRKSRRQGYPEEAVALQKQRKICRIGDYYRMSHRGWYESPVRYDVLAVDGNEIRWYSNAFDYCGDGF